MVGSICSSLRRARAAASSGALFASRKGYSEGSICEAVNSTARCLIKLERGDFRERIDDRRDVVKVAVFVFGVNRSTRTDRRYTTGHHSPVNSLPKIPAAF